MLKQAAALLFAAMCLPAVAGEAGDLTRQHLYAGTLPDGLNELRPFYERGDMEARFGVGLVSFSNGLEHFAQGLYRYGFSLPVAAGAVGLALPVPLNPEPESIDYDKFRALLQRLVEDMDAARDALMAASESGDYVVPVDLLQVRLDIDGDGVGNDAEAVGALLQAIFGGATVPGPTDSGAPPPTEAQPQSVVVGFDRADAFWIAGYTQVIAAQADFLLAHDFREMFESTFHRFFPKSGVLSGHVTGLRQGQGVGELFDPDTEVALMDAIAFIHTIDWPVTDGDRLKRVRDRLKAITGLSRANWDAILAETDNDRELLPNPNQTGITPDVKVTQAQIDAWRATLDTVDQVLEGELLVPHWRFQRGVDLKAYFDSARRTDLVMLLQGFDAVQFLRDGPVASAESFRAAGEAFGGELSGYVFWFN